MANILDTENFTTETVNGLPLPTRQTRRNIVAITLLFCMTMIGYIMVLGQPDNSLHQSGLSWAFMLMASVIFAYVFGAVVDNLNFWKVAKAATPEPK